MVGKPNVGKSTLLNAIMNKKVAITSNKPQTTRNLIQGIYNDNESQMVFIDTPGIHKAKNKLGYRPRFTPEEAIERAVAWMRDEGML